jgi:small Trp-rich protein
MLFVLIGTALLILRAAEIGPFAELSWWWVALPFITITLWWAFADATGITQRKAMDKMEERKVKRRERDMEALGLNTRRAKRLDAIRRVWRPTPTKTGAGAKDSSGAATPSVGVEHRPGAGT